MKFDKSVFCSVPCPQGEGEGQTPVLFSSTRLAMRSTKHVTLKPIFLLRRKPSNDI